MKIASLILSLLLRAVTLLQRRVVLRRPIPWRRLVRTSDSRTLIRLAWPASARNLAMAASFLPIRQQEEVAIAYLCCRVLDAYEDLTPSHVCAMQSVRQAARYLCGDTQIVPVSLLGHPTRETDRLERFLSTRIDLLREALHGHLSPAARARVFSLLRRTAAGMCRALRMSRDTQGSLLADQSSRYGDMVLGAIVEYAAKCVLPNVTIDRRLCRAVGRVLQTANDLRDLNWDEFSGCRLNSEPRQLQAIRRLLRLLPELSLTRQFLEKIQAHGGPGVRACAAVMVETTTRFFEKWLRARTATGPSPLRRALASLVSIRAFGRLIEGVERSAYLIADAACRGFVGTTSRHIMNSQPASTGDRARRYLRYLIYQDPRSESRIIIEHAAEMTELALSLHQLVQPELLAQGPSQVLAGTLIVGDYVALCAVLALANLGGDAVATLGSWLLGYLRANPLRNGVKGAAAGAVSHYLSQCKAEPSEIKNGLALGRQIIAAALRSLDESLGNGSGWRHRRVLRHKLSQARLQLAALPKEIEQMLRPDWKAAEQIAWEV